MTDDELTEIYRAGFYREAGDDLRLAYVAGLRAVYNRGRADAGSQVTSDGCVRVSNERAN